MISVENLSLQYGKRVLFDEVNIKFTQGNCYGIIGANGAGKSTFLKILTGEIDSTSGRVNIENGKRLAALKQDHREYDDETVLNTVMRGHSVLWNIMEEKNALYAKEDFSDEDGVRASELEGEFAEMDGWNAESDAAALLSGLNIAEDIHYTEMKNVDASMKVRILLAQALFGDPDILILDEPTNDLDLHSINWLENFLMDFKNTVLVVSHDRHFLDTVCTHVVDIDFKKIKQYVGNYTFWYQSSQLALRQRQSANKKAEDRAKELKEFIARFSANASKSKQATSKKKMLDKIKWEDIQPSSRKYPAIIFKPERQAGNQILAFDKVSFDKDGQTYLKNIDFSLNGGDKIAIISKNSLAIDYFMEIAAQELQPTSGKIEYGQTITTAYLPADNSEFFNNDLTLMEWLRQYTDNKDEVFVRGFLGKMLFSGDEIFKKTSVLSGGEKVRCMISRMMLQGANHLIVNEPTNHLDLESIQAFNNSLIDFPGTVLFSSHDHQFVQTVANRIIELTPDGFIDKLLTYDEYLERKRAEEENGVLA